mgnify:FL=1
MKNINDLTSKEIKSEIQHLRLKRHGLRFILDKILLNCPNIDPIICLNFICGELLKNNFSFSKREVYTCFNKYFNKSNNYPIQRQNCSLLALTSGNKQSFQK